VPSAAKPATSLHVEYRPSGRSGWAVWFIAVAVFASLLAMLLFDVNGCRSWAAFVAVSATCLVTLDALAWFYGPVRIDAEAGALRVRSGRFWPLPARVRRVPIERVRDVRVAHGRRPWLAGLDASTPMRIILVTSEGEVALSSFRDNDDDEKALDRTVKAIEALIARHGRR
jgi:membrane protein YdbS with pleckstrin-like domain